MNDTLTDTELHAMYNDYIDELNQNITIGNLTYSPSEVLKAVDHVAYRVGFDDWLDSEVESETLGVNDNEEYYVI